MKQWRVGTLSMGIALVVFGVTLFVSQMKGNDAFGVLFDWWPLIFILLGIELLVYLGMSRMAQPVVKYDVFSIFIVGFMCIAGLGGAVLASSGLLQEIRFAVSAEERYESLTDVVERVPDQVKRVIVQNRTGRQIAIDKTPESTIHIFGGYSRTVYASKSEDLTVEAAKVKTVGDTMYVEITDPPRHKGIRSEYPQLELTVVVPEHVQADVFGEHHLL